MKKTNNYLLSFLHRGALFGGLGPIVAGIVYFIIDKCIDGGITINGNQVLIATVSSYLLAFVQAGASVFNQIEHWPIAKSLLCHFGCIYIAYSLCYVVNSWIPFEPMVLLIFTAIFVVVYFVIWLTVFFAVRATGNRLNRQIIG